MAETVHRIQLKRISYKQMTTVSQLYDVVHWFARYVNTIFVSVSVRELFPMLVRLK